MKEHPTVHGKATLQAAKEMSTEKETGIGRDPSLQGTREGSRLSKWRKVYGSSSLEREQG